MGSFSSKCCSLILVVVQRRKEEIVDYQVIMQIEIAATLLPRGIFRARPIGSCCINSSLDLSLGSDGLAFPPPFSWWLFQPLVTISPIARNFSAEQGVYVFSEFSSLFPAASRSVLAFLFECKHPVLSSKLHSVPPPPTLVPWAKSPHSWFSPYLCQSVRRGKWQSETRKSYNDSCMVIHLPTYHQAPAPLVIFSQPEVSSTCEMVQHLALRRAWSVWDRYSICRSNVAADVGFPVVLRWSNIMKR